jgi:hypothetical protein
MKWNYTGLFYILRKIARVAQMCASAAPAITIHASNKTFNLIYKNLCSGSFLYVAVENDRVCFKCL